MVIVLAIVSAGFIGSGSVPAVSPSPAASSSPALGGLGSPSPTADACTTVLAGMALPAVTLTSPAQFGQRRQVATTVTRVDDAGFVVPVDRTVEIAAGASMRVEVGDARCVNELRVDLHGVAIAGSDALAVGGLVPLSDGRRYTFSAPPAGDWVLRVGLRVAAPAEFAGLWAVYFFRLNSGYVAYESPLPSFVVAQGGGSEGPLETPAIPCIAPSAGTRNPLSVDLVRSNGESIPGIPATGPQATWESAMGSGPLPPAIEGLPPTPLDVDEAVEFQIAGAVCAVRWQVDAGRLPAQAGGPGGPFDQPWWWAGQTDNDGRDPAIVAQNVIGVRVASVGDFVVRLVVDIPDLGGEAILWPVRVAGPELPAARIAGPDGVFVTMTPRCGASYELTSGTYAADACVPSWPLLPDGPVLDVAAGSLLRVDAPGWTILRWWAQYADRRTVADAGGLLDDVSHLADGGSDLGFASFELPVPPRPDPSTMSSDDAAYGWLIQVSLSVRTADGVTTAPYYARVRVAP